MSVTGREWGVELARRSVRQDGMSAAGHLMHAIAHLEVAAEQGCELPDLGDVIADIRAVIDGAP